MPTEPSGFHSSENTESELSWISTKIFTGIEKLWNDQQPKTEGTILLTCEKMLKIILLDKTSGTITTAKTKKTTAFKKIMWS